MSTDTNRTTASTLNRPLISLMAIAIGIIVANLYYLQPLLHQMTRDFHVGAASASLLITLIQVGYAAGLVFVLPLGDLIERRLLVTTIFIVSAIMMGVAALLTSFVAFAIVTIVIGVTSVGGQVIIPFAADLANPEQRGRVIGRVMSGLLLGILLSRTVSGLVAQAAGWRTMYWIAAGLLIVTASVLYRVLPNELARDHVSYRMLVASSFALLAAHRALRRRAWFGALVFASFSATWTTLAFHLSAAPFHYSNGVIGLFGLFGVAGVVAANVAGHHADAHRTHLTTIVAAVVSLVSYGLLWLGRSEVWAIALGVMVLDAGMQGMQISSQSIIYALVPDARSRINSIYMMCCFAGAAAGSYAAGQLFAAYGWGGFCVLGAGISVGLIVPAVWWRWPRTTTSH
jgi:predicted MFS family arabinose efflux permease